MRYPRISREHEIEHSISQLIDIIDSVYHPSFGAIAGLSDGARIAANVANIRPDRISSVGLFSPVLHKAQLPKDTALQYYIYVGKYDIFKANGKRFHRRMEKMNFPHQFIELGGKHNWPMWRRCLAIYLSELHRLHQDD